MKLYTYNQIYEILNEFKKEKVIAFPTDTVFGLACYKDDNIGIDKIYELKKRSIDKKLPIMFSSVNEIYESFKVSKNAKKLISAFMPGAFTIILEEKLTTNTYAIRIPLDKDLINLLKHTGPLCVTSANLSGHLNIQDYHDVVKTFDDLDICIKGISKDIVASTIVKCINDEVEIIRIGKISKQEIDEVINA